MMKAEMPREFLSGRGLGVDDQRVGARAVGDPHLRAVEDVAVALLHGVELHRDDVRAGIRLRHGERAEMFAGHQLGEIAALLFVRAPAPHLVDAEVGVRAVGQAHRGGGAADLLHRDDVLEIAEARAAPFFFDGDAEEAQLAHPRPEVARELVRAVDLGRTRGDFGLGEAS